MAARWPQGSLPLLTVLLLCPSLSSAFSVFPSAPLSLARRAACDVMGLGQRPGVAGSWGRCPAQLRRAASPTVVRAGIESADVVLSEAEVEAMVENAEKLWTVAMEAREVADDLAAQAVAWADKSTKQSEDAAEAMEGKTFSLSMVAKSQMAVSSSTEATSLTMQASDQGALADQLETEAEAALAESEQALENLIISQGG
mmetsp:Transcript_42168/g.100097  ORF Transcript_42168/g.100097 Transcript_42168/m.100097 type:complete len:200 (+) Transcript_42168:13-612(+)